MTRRNIAGVRTTIDLPDDLHDAARRVARDSDISLSAAVALLIRNGMRPKGTVEFRISEATGMLAANVGRPITAEDVRSLEDD